MKEKRAYEVRRWLGVYALQQKIEAVVLTVCPANNCSSGRCQPEPWQGDV